MKDEIVLFVPLAMVLAIIVLLVVMIQWTYNDFVSRCTTMGGVMITDEVCVDPDTNRFLAGM